MIDESKIIELLCEEVAAKAQPMEVVLSPLTVIQLVGALQLAQRHPHFAEQESVARATERFITAAREYFVDCPIVLDVIRRGDPTEDR